MNSFGINIGSSSLKVVMMEGDSVKWNKVVPHDGDFAEALKRIFEDHHITSNAKGLVTGTEGRYLFSINNVIEPICIEEAVKHLGIGVNAVVSMGGEDLVVYSINEENKIVNNFSGSKCASGTGEFFKQQLARMDMVLDDVNKVSEESKVLSLSARCSVFMKSDCTHRLNKREATKDDIVLSLSNVMAVKVVDFLNKARVKNGKVLLTGGTAQNKHIIRFIREKAPEIEFIIPEEAPYFEALGAAILAKKSGTEVSHDDHFLKTGIVRFDTLPDLNTAEKNVTYFTSEMGKVIEGGEYILGVDGGSTTTKACLIDINTDQVVASHYGRTHGDPVAALKKCIIKLQEKIRADIGDGKIKISLSATTGSSREILGVFLETSGVYNEIIAHSVGTTHFSKDVDTIFEIGGQDAKYVLLKNGVPIDYAMNEACSAGTGSFLEESAQGDLNISHAWEIGEIALSADSPLKFGEHCSAFINSDIRKSIQQGATKGNITAGIITSIVSNYLNRVVGNRTIGKKIFLQGGVAKNRAVPLAFAMFLDKEILVPPSPELMGCFGVGLLARQKFENNLLEKAVFDLDAILETKIVYERVFDCKACENRCPIQVLNVNEHKYMFGGRCNKYTNMRNKVADNTGIVNYVEKRSDLMFIECAPDKDSFIKKRDYTVGIPRAFSVHTLYPLYSWFFHTLGIETILSDEVSHEGVARVESTYCFPAEIAHGAVQDIVNKNTDYIFLPHFRDMPSYETDIHANFCPITQSLPYYIKQAYPDVPEEKILPLVVSFKLGKLKAREFFVKMGRDLNIPEEETIKAFDTGFEKQEQYFAKARELGKKALDESREAGRPVIALLGRPYNAFTPEANMGIPRKFTSRGFSIIPYDILPFEGEEIFPNMYWYYGQQDMKAAAMLKNEPNLYITFISNFSCAPDSFMLHYVKWLMGTKPFLILELDSHSADAGIDTRIEAFLDIIDGYRNKSDSKEEERYDNGLRFMNEPNEEIYIRNIHTDEKIKIRENKKVKILLSNMGDLSTNMIHSMVTSIGYNAIPLPKSNFETLHMARSHASGKECVPSHLVLGSALQFFSSDQYRKDEIYMLFVPITTGPCRTGQYFVFMENLFRDMRLENVLVFTLSADNSYNELGPGFSREMWYGIIAADLLKDIQTSLRACAVDPDAAIERFNVLWHKMIEAGHGTHKKLLPALKVLSREMTGIQLKRSIKDSPKVLIVGEIYVRRDDFAVDELIQLFSNKGIIGKVSGISEWIHYLDFVREYDLKKRLKLAPWYKKILGKERRGLIVLAIERMWKKSVENNIKKILEPTKLIPHTPHNMKQIMANTEEHFLSHELNSEIVISSGVAATAMEEGYSGIVNISPFACLIGRVIEGIYTPWARERKYPTISVEVDGNLLPPNIINKLNIFIVNVLRFKEQPEIGELIEENTDGEPDADQSPAKEKEDVPVV